MPLYVCRNIHLHQTNNAGKTADLADGDTHPYIVLDERDIAENTDRQGKIDISHEDEVKENCLSN